MSNMEKIRILFLNLVEIGAPSGYEEPIIEFVKKAMEPRVDKVWDTVRGNVIGVQEGSNPNAPKVALVAHMDQIGFTVFNIDDRGFIYFREIGGTAMQALQGQHLRLITEKGPVIGVVGVKHAHITKPEEANKIPPINELYIDIGANSREEAHEMGVKVGTPIVFHVAPMELGNDQIASPSVDDRAGLTALLMIADTLKAEDIPSTVYYIGTIEEEAGLRGAEIALHDLAVDMAIAVDTFPAGYEPDVEMRDIFYEVGKGPGIHVGEIGGGRVRIQSQVIANWLREMAEEKGIPYQSGFMHGGTDALALMQTKGGLPATTVGIPRKYSHSAIETFDLKDLNNIIKLLLAGLRDLDEGFKLHRV
jgi:endoglucanase